MVHSGTDGDLRMTGPTGLIQIGPLSIARVRHAERQLAPLAIPADGLGLMDSVSGNIARYIAACLQTFMQARRRHRRSTGRLNCSDSSITLKWRNWGARVIACAPNHGLPMVRPRFQLLPLRR